MPEGWIALTIWAGFVAMDTTGGPQWLYSDPIVAAPIAGWLIGDIASGLVIGVVLQLAWSASVPAGSSRFLDVQVASVVATGIASAMEGGPVGWFAGLLWMVPVGALGSVATVTERRIFGVIVARASRPEVGLRAVEWLHLSGLVISFTRGILLSLVGLFAGWNLVKLVGANVDLSLLPPWVWMVSITGVAAGISLGHVSRRTSPLVVIAGAVAGGLVALLMWWPMPYFW